MPTETRKYLDDTGVALLWSKIKLAIADKPDVNTTYTLSQDATDGHKFTLSGSDGYSATITIPDNGEVNTIESVSVNGSAITPSASKNVDISVPTKVSDITNDSNFQTDTQVTAAINQALAGITSIDFVVVASYQDLPATGTKGVFYLVPHTAGTNDIYDEYIWAKLSGDTYGYELIGTTAVDLSDYMKISDWNNDTYITPITSGEIDEICV